VVATIPVRYNPVGIVTSPDGNKVYVSTSGGVDVIEAATNKVIHSVLVSNFSQGGITVSPDAKWIYLADPNNGGIDIINAVTYQQTKISFPTNILDSSVNVVTSPDGSIIYVTGGNADNIFVINAATQQLMTPISLTKPAVGIAISPDGKRIYVTNQYSDMVSVVNGTTGSLITTIPVGSAPEGISVSPDGSMVYVANVGSNNMSIISTATNQVTATVAAGANPHSLGNFVSSSTSCSGPPITFSITVNPSPATITASSVTGNISACQGMTSATPNIQQFTVSGNRLTSDITATAPAGFEVSLTAGSGYSSNVTLSQINSVLSSTVVYVRSAEANAVGNISGNVILSSTGATDQNVAVTGIVNALPIVNQVAAQTVNNGNVTAAVNFSGTANTYTWTNDTPDIGLAASGIGSIPSFTAHGNNNNTPVIATITVTPASSAGCTGTPVTFTITVNPVLTSVITAQSTLTGLTTVYGTASKGESFHISGTDLTAGILVTAPNGFAVSNDGVSYGNTTLMSGTGIATNIKIFIRLASTTPVGAYTGNIVLSAPNAVSVNVLMPLSTVTPASLSVTVDDKTKAYGTPNPPFTVTYGGFVNNENVSQLTRLPDVTTTANASSAAGQYPITAADALAANYSFTYIPGVLTIEPAAVVTLTLAIPNTFTPNGDGINDTWEIKNLNNYPKSTVAIFNRWGQQVFSSIGYPTPWNGTYKGSILPSGTYYYIIDPKNGQAAFSGPLTIIR
jgi:gliding motility-associated-like protein